VISVEEARERILSRICVRGTERVDLPQALQRVLAEDLVATRDIPPWPNSSMDGYALRSGDTRSASAHVPAKLTVAGRVAAGAVAARPLRAGKRSGSSPALRSRRGRIASSAQEDVTTDGSTVEISRPVADGDFVSPAERTCERERPCSRVGAQLAPPSSGCSPRSVALR